MSVQDNVVLPLRVLHVLGSIDPAVGGPVTATAAEMRMAQIGGCEISVLARSGPETLNGVHAHVVHRPDRFERALRELVRSHDVVHVHGLYRFHTYASSRAALSADRRLVVEPHGSLTDYQWRQHRGRKTVFEQLLDRRVLEKAGSVLVASSMEQRELTAKFRATCVVVPHTFPPDMRRSVDSAAQRAGVLFLGRLAKKKRLDLVLEAWPSVVAACPDARLTIAGPGSSRDKELLSARIGALPSDVRTTVNYVGPMYGVDRDRLFDQHRVFTLPSDDENFGNAIVEALLAGLQVHATERCGAVEYLPRDKEAVAVSALTRESVAAAMIGLLLVPPSAALAAVERVQSEVADRLSDASGWAQLAIAYGAAVKGAEL